jgi:hypothetical protein
MKSRICYLSILLLAVFVPSPAFAQTNGFGLGIILGEPTGISGKIWTTEQTAVDGAVAWSLVSPGALYMHADFLHHNFNLFEVDQGQLPLYYGIGGRVVGSTEPRLGARIPLGIAYYFGTAPIDVFAEIVPVLDLIPATEFSLNAALGIRFFF